MAPQQQQQHHQQNSTFINDNSDTCPSLLNLPDSPILPLKHQHYRQYPDNTNNNRLSAEHWMNTEVTTPTAVRNEPHKDSSRRPNHRSISLYGANSTRLRLSLKHRQKINESTSTQFMELTRPAPDSFSIFKWLKRIFYFGNKSKLKTNDKTRTKSVKAVNKIKEKCLPAKIKEERSDKLLRVILPDQHYEDPQTNKNIKAELKHMMKAKATQREHAQQGKLINSNCIRHHRKNAPLRNSLRNKLATLHTEMNMRYNREYKLTRQLTAMYKHYTLQNKQYLCTKMELSVGHLQHNIEGYAVDIIKTERELLELRNEIKRHISLIHNMKRMTIEQYCGIKPTTIKMSDCTVGVLTENSPGIPQDAKIICETPLANNIHEFYDNNPSMLL
ncbi:uncharacterized protein LOC6558641 isoform X2 [Drosophila grimshawi]|uniref:uncharacterized protein LOC6558641 isoform X2 n=1 Tax=Drosophila grimshawi TaxID=7222 RepID=UPI000C86E655|nr:uncharacterized protein LOC6558641 isoform X2 [Drosophila grimshawi]